MPNGTLPKKLENTVPNPRPDTHIAYFGYGSLVNQATHRTDIAHYSKVRLKGWRRHWLPRSNGFGGPAALLSVVRDADSEIEGLVVTDFARNLPALDERERNYKREELPVSSLTIPDNQKNAEFDGIKSPKAQIYVATQKPEYTASNESKILRSYLDAVMQGYLNNFGREGLLRFIETTDNFEIGILEDRGGPRYPRSVLISSSERQLFDELAPSRI